MRKTRWIAGPLLALSLFASACGDDGGKTTTPPPSDGGSGGGSDCTIDGAVKLVGLAEKPPEGPSAIADTAEGWEMAMDKLGSELCGQKLEFKRIPASPTDGGLAVNAYLQALDANPTVIVGLPSSTAVLAAAPEVKKNGVPTIFMALAPQAFADGPAGSEWGFTIRPRNSSISTEVVNYVATDLKAKRVGLLCVNNAFGTAGCDAADKAAKAAGLEIVARESNETTDTDLTSKVTSFKSANVDAVIAFSFPNNLVVFYNQADEAGLDVPIFGGSSTGLAMAGIKPAARKTAWGTDDCVPVSDAGQAEWVAAYEKKFNKKMIGAGYTVAEAYDSLMFAAKAIETAGSTEPKAVADAMRELEYKGVCTTYKADAGQGLHHASDIVKFDADGVGESKKLLTLD